MTNLTGRVKRLEDDAGGRDQPTYGILCGDEPPDQRVYLMRPGARTWVEVSADTDLTGVVIVQHFGWTTALDELHGGHLAPPRE